MNNVADEIQAPMMKRSVRRVLTGVLLGAAVGGVLTACSTVPIPPTYTQGELKAICERRGGWWHDDNLWGRGLCEYQAASLQAP